MNVGNSDPKKSRLYLLLFLSFILVIVSYSNSLDAGWHFDDEQNILTNSKIHITELSFDKIANAITHYSSSDIYRPLPMFTFALNWYFNQDNVYSYHVVNILMHILTAYVLFSIIQLLFHCCYAEQYSPSFINTTAVLAALLWALAPIQTQAVTYIVQRMAAMAAMFTIFAVYAYLRARIEKTQKKYYWFLLCLMCYFAALGSKSNSILLPASLFLLEISFFDAIKTKIAAFRIIFLSVVVLIIAVLFVYYGLNLNPLKLEGYAHRPFTLTERLLTEPRIVVMYLSQLALPIADRLSFEHDIVLSTSFFSPWTTLPALLFIFSSVFLSLRYLRKYPVFTFPVIFYFLNQLVESTFIPLELVFEHRNYLPSLFFFLPIGYLFAQALYGKTKFSTFGRIALMFCGALYLAISAHATYTRNQAWATDGSLWSDALKKAPLNSRAALNLGIWYSESNGDYNKAYYYFLHALKYAENAQVPKYTKCLVLNSLALNRIKFNQYDQAYQYVEMCLAIENNIDCQERKVDIYLRQELYQDALSVAKLLADNDTYPAKRYTVKAAIAAYHAKEFETSLLYLRRIVHSSLDHHQIMYLTGLVLMKMEVFKNSLLFLKRANQLSPDVIKYSLVLAAAYHAAGKVEATTGKEVIHEIVNKNSLSSINSVLVNMKKNELLDEDSFQFIKTEITDLVLSSNLVSEKNMH